MTILFAIFLFSILIFVHELGHFVAAKLSGVQVNEFSMFMGPAIWKKQVGETLYSIRLVPIGGYCAMEGEDADTDSPRSFQKAAWWKRLVILVAGSFMNFLIGAVLMVLVYLPAQQVADPVIDSFEPFATVDDGAGLQTGDRILEVDGEKIYVYSDFSMILDLNPGNYHDLVVQRGDHSGQNLPVAIAPHAHFQPACGSGFLLPHSGQNLPVAVAPQAHFQPLAAG